MKFSSTYEKHQDEVVLTLGEHVRFSRRTMRDDLHNAHYTSGKFLTKVFKRLGVTTIHGIKRIPMVSWAMVEGLGEAALHTLLDLLTYEGYSRKEIDGWVSSDLSNGKLVQWESICRQAEKMSRKRGKHAA